MTSYKLVPFANKDYGYICGLIQNEIQLCLKQEHKTNCSLKLLT